MPYDSFSSLHSSQYPSITSIIDKVVLSEHIDKKGGIHGTVHKKRV